jgi:hypothetical protein
MTVGTMNSAIPSKKELQERWARLRSHRRAAASVKLLVEWEDGETRQQANGVTVDVSGSGCMAIVAADLPLRRHVRLICPESGRCTEGEVVWRGHEAWDLGIAFTNPDDAFWGAIL